MYLLPPLTRHRIIISWTKLIIWWAKCSCGVKYQVEGLEHLEGLDKPLVVLSKHQSAWETFFLQGLFWPASTVLKKELLRIPFFGWGLAALRPIAIDRDNPREALKQVKTEGKARLEDEINLILFPEGTRVPIGEKGNYARSGADIAKSANKLIIPVCHNAGYYWGNGGSFVKKPGTISVVIGKPIDSNSADSKHLIADVETWIEATLEDIERKREARGE
jgi:1-acyl-sn-glycerol-3-phosphate acyltransferase